MLVLIPATLLTDFLLGRTLRRQRTEALEASLRTTARAAAVHAADTPVERWGPLAGALHGACGCRVTLVDPGGAVLSDSDADPSHMENHSGRPEIAAALDGRPGTSIRYSETLRAPLLYTAVPLPPGRRRGVARAALPLTAVEAEVAQARRAIFLASFTGFLLALAAALAAARALSRPVAEMSEVARRIAAGDYAARVRTLPRDEIGSLGQALNSLAATIAATIHDLSREHGQVAAILSSIVEGVGAVDASGALIAANPALRGTLGLQNADLGRDYRESLRQPRLASMLAQTLKDGQPRLEELEVLGREDKFFEAHTAPLLADSKPWGALFVLHDVSRLRRLERMRRDFVANVSHELRTPLASIRACAETLREGAVDDKAHRMEFLEAIEKDAQSLSELVDDLLDLSAIESGQRQPALAPVAPLDVAREAAASLRPLAQRRGVAVDVEPNAALPAVRADAGQLKQVLSNLIDNAIKFNKAGGRVTVTASSDGKACTVAVADTGSGIPEGDLPHVFERFYRVDKARTREQGGTGLGLSIVKHIVEAHRGSASVQSRVGEGSVFRVSFPL